MLKTLVQHTAIYGIAGFLMKLMGLITIPIFTRMFTVEEYGTLALLITFGYLIQATARCGLTQALHRFYFDGEIEEKEKSKLLPSGFVTVCIFTFLTTVLALGALHFFNPQLLSGYGFNYTFLAIAIVTQIPQVLFIFLQDATRIYATPWVFTLLGLVASGLGVIFSLYLVVGCHSGIAGSLIGVSLGFLFTLPLTFWFNRPFFKNGSDWKYVKKMVSYGFPFIFTELALCVFGSMDQWMLGTLSSLKEAGLYTLSLRLCQVIIFLFAAFSNAWSVEAMKLYQNSEEYKEVYSRSLTLWFAFMITVGAILCFFGKYILYLIAPASYYGAIDSLPFLAMGYAICGVQGVVVMGISLAKKTYHMTIASFLAAGCNFFLNLHLIPEYGAKGAAISTFVSYCVLISYYLFVSQRLHPIPLEKAKLIALSSLIPLILLFV